MDQQLLVIPLLVFLAFFTADWADAYDAMDPDGNIIVRWDILEWDTDWNGYRASVTILNTQLYRHIGNPGWKLSWEWPKEEVILAMWGGEATLRGNCSRFAGKPPHCCNKLPVIVDLLPNAPMDRQITNCCRGGLLSSRMENESNASSTFLMDVRYITAVNGSEFSREFGTNTSSLAMPTKFSIGVDGYTCSQPKEAEQTRFPVDSGRRHEEAIRTLKITCTYAQKASQHHCCVTFSSFYNKTIVPCPLCSCACRGKLPESCSEKGQVPEDLKTLSPDDYNPSYVLCSDHMCPVEINWHVMYNHRNEWRVRVSIRNFNMMKNYSDWSLVVQHPNLDQLKTSFSFFYKPLDIYTGHRNVSGVFWGIKHYNDMLLQYGENSMVQSDISLNKIGSQFTLKNGWVFPRRIDFDGVKCVMPGVGVYPINSKITENDGIKAAAPCWVLSSFPLLIILIILFR